MGLAGVSAERDAAAERAPGVGDVRSLTAVELEVGSRCNRACSYCPVSLNPRPNVPVRMSDEVFLASLRQLAAINFTGRVSYHLYNEPLLRKDLARLAGLTRAYLPSALQLLNTNGDLLTDGRYEALREAGIDYFYVTRHSEGEYPERPFQIVQMSADLILSNRGGTLAHLPTPSPETRRSPCFVPAEMLIVTVTGDVLLCYEDAHRGHILGNVLTQSLPEIWASVEHQRIQGMLQAGDRTATSMCFACSNVSHRVPGLSALEDPVLSANGLSREDEDAVAVLKQRSTTARGA